MLRDLGAPLVDADRLAHAVVAPGAEAYAAVVAAFGPQILLPDGQIDRRALGNVVFADPVARRRLEGIVHPAVAARLVAATADLAAGEAPVAVLDVPLLLEGKLQHTVDRVWVVYVDAATQLQRLMRRDGLDEVAARQRIAAQMPLDEKLQYADVVIDNGGTQAETRRQVAKHWRVVRSQAAGGQ